MTIEAPPNSLPTIKSSSPRNATRSHADDLGDLSALRLWQLISPALPVGAYAYSQGLEFAVQQGDVDSLESAFRWINGLLQHSYCYLDLPLFYRLYLSITADDQISFMHWNALLLSFRESRELLAEDLQMGGALLRLIKDLDLQLPFTADDISFAAAFALASHSLDINADVAAQGLAFSWCENQVSCAVKLVPLGQTAGQRLLFHLAGSIPNLAAKARQIADHEIGYSGQGLALYSALHEQQYTRLFRS